MTDIPTGAAEREPVTRADLEQMELRAQTASTYAEHHQVGHDVRSLVREVRALLDEREQLAAERDQYADAYAELDSQQASAGSYAGRAEKAEAEAERLRARLQQIGDVREEWATRDGGHVDEVNIYATEAEAFAALYSGEDVVRRYAGDWIAVGGRLVADGAQDGAGQQDGEAFTDLASRTHLNYSPTQDEQQCERDSEVSGGSGGTWGRFQPCADCLAPSLCETADEDRCP